MTRIIVDTSVFINYFRGKSAPGLQELIMSDMVLLSQYVRLEILAGISKENYATMRDVLEGLILVPFHPDIIEVAEKFLVELKSEGVNAGIVDVLIASEAAVEEVPIYSFDAVFKQFEERGQIKLFRYN